MKYLLIASLLLLNGCSTRYHQEAVNGFGYSDRKISDDTFFVRFSGNRHTKKRQVMSGWVMRAQELCENRSVKVITQYDDEGDIEGTIQCVDANSHQISSNK